MKPSPLQLKWVNYPAASFEITEDFDGEPEHISVADVDAEISYRLDGTHYAFVKVDSRAGSALKRPYEFSVTVVAAFTFDLEIAKQEYKRPGAGLPPVIATNVARILYAGAREQLAMMTSRAPFGATMLDSTMLEPQDVRINSDASVPEILRVVFQVPDDELAVLQEKVALAKSNDLKKPAKKAKAKKAPSS